jgi:hypothetical protein
MRKVFHSHSIAHPPPLKRGVWGESVKVRESESESAREYSALTRCIHVGYGLDCWRESELRVLESARSAVRVPLRVVGPKTSSGRKSHVRNSAAGGLITLIDVMQNSDSAHIEMTQ